MSGDSGLDLSAFKAHLNDIDHSQITSAPMPGPDLYTQLTRRVTTNPAVVDPLKSAINSLHLKQEAK